MESYIDQAIDAWLLFVEGRSGSAGSRASYNNMIVSFRAWLGKKGRDLDLATWADQDDKNAWRQANALFRSELTAFARHRNGGGTVSPATCATRISVIRSFYEHALDGFLPDYPNPTGKVRRPRVEINDKVQALAPDHISAAMAAIDRTMVQGMRDYSLLCVFLETGRRHAEVAQLLWGDVELIGSLADLKAIENIRLALRFRRTKGGRSAYHKLSHAASIALLASMARIYDINPLYLDKERPLWPGLSRFASDKELTALSLSGIRSIVVLRMGTSKVHQLRHSFAQQCLAAGLSLPDIGLLLGHRNLATLSVYLQALSVEHGENPALSYLGRVFNIQ